MKVVCINNTKAFEYKDIQDVTFKSLLTVNKIYTVTNTWGKGTYYVIKDDSEEIESYLNTRFITLKDYRKAKLNKIYESNLY